MPSRKSRLVTRVEPVLLGLICEYPNLFSEPEDNMVRLPDPLSVRRETMQLGSPPGKVNARRNPRVARAA